MSKQSQRGLSFIELLIVVAVIGILAAVATPASQDYTVRARVTEGIAFAHSTASDAAQFHQSQSSMPTVAQLKVNMPANTDNILSIVYAQTSPTVGTISATLGARTGLAHRLAVVRYLYPPVLRVTKLCVTIASRLFSISIPATLCST